MEFEEFEDLNDLKFNFKDSLPKVKSLKNELSEGSTQNSKSNEAFVNKSIENINQGIEKSEYHTREVQKVHDAHIMSEKIRRPTSMMQIDDEIQAIENEIASLSSKNDMNKQFLEISSINSINAPNPVQTPNFNSPNLKNNALNKMLGKLRSNIAISNQNIEQNDFNMESVKDDDSNKEEMNSYDANKIIGFEIPTFVEPELNRSIKTLLGDQPAEDDIEKITEHNRNWKLKEEH